MGYVSNNEEKLLQFSSIDKDEFANFNNERIIKQFELVQKFYTRDTETAGETVRELLQLLTESRLPDYLNNLLVYGLLDIFLLYSMHFIPLEGYTSEDIINLNDISKILNLTSKEDIKNYFLKLYERVENFENTLKNQSKMGIVLDYINENFTNPQLTLSTIAKKFNLNNTYISNMFKKEFGYNILEVIHMKRISESKHLLEDTDLSISQISESVGYYSHRTFSNTFKRLERVTPTEFRIDKINFKNSIAGKNHEKNYNK